MQDKVQDSEGRIGAMAVALERLRRKVRFSLYFIQIFNAILINLPSTYQLLSFYLFSLFPLLLAVC